MSETAAQVRRTLPLPEGWEKLFTAVLSDSLDAAGCTTQAMSPQIRPLDDTLRLCGRARTGLYVEDDGVDPNTNPYELEIAIVDDLKPGEVVVFACGGSAKIAPWGSLLSTATRARGALGCITDGFVRDVQEIRRMQMPVFHGGIAPLDSKGRGHVAAIDVLVRCGGVEVSPGDLVFGDADGVVVIPRAIEADVLGWRSKRSAASTTPCVSCVRALTCVTFTPSTACFDRGALSGLCFGRLTRRAASAVHASSEGASQRVPR